MTVTTSCLKEQKDMAHRNELKCLEPLIADVNLFLPGYDSDHFMLGRTKKYGLPFRIGMFTTCHCGCEFVSTRL